MDATQAGHLPEVDDFDTLYRAHFAFVWRALVHLGVAQASLEDAAQDVFLVVHRRRQDFAGRSAVRTWIYGITLRVARDYRRRVARKGGLEELPPELVSEGLTPHDELQRLRARQELSVLLRTLDDDQREVLVMVELLQLSVAEAAEALEIKLNTAYSRLRLAREGLERSVAREKARQQREIEHG